MLLRESYSKNILTLYKYLTKTKEDIFDDLIRYYDIHKILAHYLLKFLVKRHGEKKAMKFINIFNNYSYEKVINFLEKHQNIKRHFRKFIEFKYDNLYLNLIGVKQFNYPSYYFFDEIKLLPETWLIHFTDKPFEISKNGFKYGVNDMKKLGLTTLLPKSGIGFNFAFKIDDFEEYVDSYNTSNTYGFHCVIFRASGVEAYHRTDEERQVIFEGITAKNIVPIVFKYFETINGDKKNSFGEWCVYDKDRKNILYKNEDLKESINYVIDRYGF